MVLLRAVPYVDKLLGESKYKRKEYKYSTIPHTKTSKKLLIIQLLYFMRISYKAGEAKWLEKRNTRNQSVKQFFFFFLQYNVTNFPTSQYIYL